MRREMNRRMIPWIAVLAGLGMLMLQTGCDDDRGDEGVAYLLAIAGGGEGERELTPEPEELQIDWTNEASEEEIPPPEEPESEQEEIHPDCGLRVASAGEAEAAISSVEVSEPGVIFAVAGPDSFGGREYNRSSDNL